MEAGGRPEYSWFPSWCAWRNMLWAAVTATAAELVDCVYHSCRAWWGDCLLIAKDGLEAFSEGENAQEFRAAGGTGISYSAP